MNSTGSSLYRRPQAAANQPLSPTEQYQRQQTLQPPSAQGHSSALPDALSPTGPQFAGNARPPSAFGAEKVPSPGMSPVYPEGQTVERRQSMSEGKKEGMSNKRKYLILGLIVFWLAVIIKYFLSPSVKMILD